MIKWIKNLKWRFNDKPRCRICHKPLHTAKDIKAGIGSACAKKEVLKERVAIVARAVALNPDHIGEQGGI